TFSGGDDERRGAVDLRAVLDAALNVAHAEIKHRALVTRELDDGLPLIEANEARVAQIFLNLLLNAAQAIPEGQADQNRITARARRDESGDVIVEIVDTGAGIPEATRPRIFDPFFTTRPVGAGLGLGLTVSQNLVAALGGEIAVESEVGRGSTFRVRLPARLAIARPAPPGEVMDAPPRRSRLLIVDDEPMVANALRRTLSAEHDVVICHAATEAIERIRAGERFDVILCDLMMPELTGMDLHDVLAADAPEQAARMLF